MTDKFQNRDQEKQVFKEFLNEPTKWCLAIFGFSGYGKSALINSIKTTICEPNDISCHLVNASQWLSYQSILNDLILGLKGKVDSEIYNQYISSSNQILRDRRIFGDSININQSQIMGSHNIQEVNLNLVDALAKADSFSQSDMTESWLECFHHLSVDQHVIFIDTFDGYQLKVTSDQVEWLLSTLARASEIFLGLKVVIGSNTKIKQISDGFILQELKGLSNEHAIQVLINNGVNDREYCEAINNRLAYGHPLMLKLSSTAWIEARGNLKASDIPSILEHSQAINWIQTKVLNLLRQPLKKVVEWSVLLREFDYEIITALIDSSLSSDDYKELCNLSFVENKNNTQRLYHNLLRSILISQMKYNFEKEYLNFHRKAAIYYENRNDTINGLYHRFFYETDVAFRSWLRDSLVSLAFFDHEKYGKLVSLIYENEILDLLNPNQHDAINFCYARYLQNIGADTEAASLFIQVHQNYALINDNNGMANCLVRMLQIQIHNHVGIFDSNQLSGIFEQTRSMFRSQNDIQGSANLLLFWAQYEETQGNNKIALDLLGEARNYFKQLPNPVSNFGLANINMFAGELLFRNGKKAKAFRFLDAAYSQYIELAHNIGQANVLLNYGEKLVQVRRYQDAYEKFSIALEIYDDARNDEGILKSLAAIWDLEERNGNIITLTSLQERLVRQISVSDARDDLTGKVKSVINVANFVYSDKFLDEKINEIHVRGKPLALYVGVYKNENQVSLTLEKALSAGFIVMLADSRHRITEKLITRMINEFGGRATALDDADRTDIDLAIMKLFLPQVNDNIIIEARISHSEYPCGIAILTTEWTHEFLGIRNFSAQITKYEIIPKLK